MSNELNEDHKQELKEELTEELKENILNNSKNIKTTQIKNLRRHKNK
jgi:hypothetical protein